MQDSERLPARAPGTARMLAAARSAVVATPAWAVLVGLIGVSAALRFWASRGVPTPWIAPDEMIYGTLGQNLYREGQLTILDGPTPFYSLVYPLSNGIALSWNDLELGYSVLKGLQAVVMSLAAVPVYLWGRSLVARPYALLAAALTLAIPGLAYTGLVMTEVAFYPILALAFWAMATALPRPTLANQALLVAAIAVAASTRLQAIVLFPIFATAVALKALFDRRLASATLLWPTFAGLAVVTFAWIAWRLVRGGAVLGGYQAAGDTSYSLGHALRYIGYHTGDVLLMTGLFPACALALLAIEAAGGRETSDRVCAFLAVAVAAPVWFVLQVGTFASEHVGRLAERDLLPVAPLLFLALSVWLERGAARPRFRTSVIAIVAAIPVLSLPVEKFVSAAALPDAFSLVPFFRLHEHDPGLNLEVIVFGGATAVAALFVLLPRRFVLVLPFALLAGLAATSFTAARHVEEQAKQQQVFFLGPKRRWIDRATDGARTAYLFEGSFFWNEVWEQVFWNRTVSAVYDLPGTNVKGPLPQTGVRIRDDGRVVRDDGRPIPERYVVAATAYQVAGHLLWSIATPGGDQSGLYLWRLRGPFRIRSAVSGIGGDRSVRGRARLVVYGCARGRFRIAVQAIKPLRFELRQNGRPLRVVSHPPYSFAGLKAGETWSTTVAADPVRAPGRSTCTLELRTGGPMYARAFRFERAPAR
jgi:hypothetical protein